MICAIDGCARPALARRMCSMHYNRWNKTGDPGTPAPASRAGAANSNWKGGRVRGGHQGRYFMLFVPQHPHANGNGYVLEHRVVVERHLGRLLSDDEIVHHVNGDTTDNRVENLEVMTQAEHVRHHFAKGAT